jgi:hypothetical protein
VVEVPLPTGEDLAMRAVHVRAEAMIHHAFGLARRGAHYSAKAELVEVLRTTTQALDMRDGTTAHSDALARAFRALDEASDFQPRGAGLESNLDMAMLVAGHQTPALKEADLTKVTPLAGLQRYYTYAQQQFIIAGEEQPVASAALYGLGRLETIMTGAGAGGLSQGAPQAMVFHQAAVLTDGNNYKSSNELGVLLARYGQYDAAREMLIHTVRVRPNSQSWQNLASVHERMGEMDLARRAMHEAKLIASGQGATADVEAPVRWVPAETLARSAPQSDDQLISPVSNRTPAAPTSPRAQPESREVRGIMKFLPWSRAAD